MQSLCASSSFCFRNLSSSSSSGRDDELDECLDRHLAKPNTPGAAKQSIATTRRESLSLYRDILRFSRFFTWTDQNGVPFSTLIRESARKEYEAARFEKDPQIVNKLIVSGRDCLHKSLQNVIDRQKEIVEQERNVSQNRNPDGSPNNNNPFPFNY